MSRETRRDQAAQTLAIVERGRYVTPRGTTVDIADAIRACRENTRLLSPGDLYALADEVSAQPSPRYATRIDVVNETALGRAAARRGRRRGRGVEPRVGEEPRRRFPQRRAGAGGIARAQFRVVRIDAPAFYERHRGSPSLLYSDAMILSPRCPVFRNDAGTLLDAPYLVSFITSVAPNAGAITQQRRDELPLIDTMLARRARLVLALAASQGWCRLVLGAWGCGVFRNDPRTVAGIFGALLRGDVRHGRFERVVFSVLDASPAQPTFRAFRHALAS